MLFWQELFGNKNQKRKKKTAGFTLPKYQKLTD